MATLLLINVLEFHDIQLNTLNTIIEILASIILIASFYRKELYWL